MLVERCQRFGEKGARSTRPTVASRKKGDCSWTRLHAARGSCFFSDSCSPDSLGFPLGFWIAAGITVFEIVGTPLLALGRWVSALCLVYCFIYLMGIVLVHWPAGWFVVGLGRNGMEYSVLLIACLVAQAWVHWPERRKTRS